MNGYPRTDRLACAIALALLVATRFGTAWMLRVETNPDFAIVQLMARHVLEGRPWPIFFYGQTYMGSLEPLLGALVSRLAGGWSTFAVNLGTALCGLAAMIVAAAWAQRAAGTRAAWATLAYGAIGPAAYVHYMASPRGGYATLLLLSVAVLALGAQLLEHECAGSPPRAAAYLLLGLLAGLGFWSNMLIAPALGAVAVAFLGWRRLRAFHLRIVLPVLLGFTVGAAPFWLWNLHHDWASLAMSDSVTPTATHLRTHLRLLFGIRWQQLLGVAAAPPGVRALVLTAHAGLMLPAWFCLRRTGRSGTADAVTRQLSLVAAYLVLFAAGFSLSQFARSSTPRYLLPLVPLVAWLGGLSVTLPRPRAVRILAALSLAVALGWQVRQLAGIRALAERHAAATTRNRAAAAALREAGIEAVYAAYLLYALNLVTDEHPCVTDPRGDRYLPFARHAEQATHIAVLENLGGVTQWAQASGGSATARNVQGLRLCLGFHPSTEAVRELSPSRWASLDDADGRDFRATLGDRRLDTALHGPRQELTLRLDAPTVLSGVRLWGADTAPFGAWRLAGRSRGGSAFTDLSPTLGYAPFFWSGPRPYWSGPQHRQELRFAPRELLELRVNIEGRGPGADFTVPELQLLVPASDEAPGAEVAPDLAPLLAELGARGIRRLYADRWVANHVHEATRGSVWTPRNPRALDEAERTADDDDAAPMRLDATTAVLMPAPGVPALRETLDARLIVACETDLGSLGTLFTAPDGNSAWRTGLPTGIRTCGAYALLTEGIDWAAARLLIPGTATNTAALDDLLKTCPDFAPALRARLGLAERTDPALADALRTRLAPLTTPQLGAAATFGGRFTWLGCRVLGHDALHPGDRLTVRHYWEADAPPTPNTLACFVHFIGPGGYRFQDDHPLLAGAPAWPAAPEMPWFVDRRVVIPADAPPGPYELQLGVCDARLPSRRLAVQGTLPQRRRAVRVADALHLSQGPPDED